MNDYISKTIAAYNNNPQKYVQSTSEMAPMIEVEEFMGKLTKGATVLDAGCAFGRDSKLFVEGGFKVIGIDLSEELLKTARTLVPTVDFRLMDLRKLEFPNDTFDGIWCSAVLLHFNGEDIKTVLNEFYRVMKPGGVIFISLKKGQGSEEIVEPFSSDLSRYFAYHTEDTLKSLLTNAGLKIMKLYSINEKERFGQDKRDLDWVFSFSVK